MKSAAILTALLLAAACQRAPSTAAPAAAETPAASAAPAASDAAPAPAALDPAAIMGEWQPYSRGADQEFGALEIAQERIVFARMGTADYRLRGRYATLVWRDPGPGARDLCGEAPPGVIAFELENKSETLAPGTPGQWLHVSFFADAAAAAAEPGTPSSPCRISTWSR